MVWCVVRLIARLHLVVRPSDRGGSDRDTHDCAQVPPDRTARRAGTHCGRPLARSGLDAAASALGPLAVSIGCGITGSYVEVLRLLVIIPLIVLVLGLGLFAPMPTREA